MAAAAVVLTFHPRCRCHRVTQVRTTKQANDTAVTWCHCQTKVGSIDHQRYFHCCCCCNILETEKEHVLYCSNELNWPIRNSGGGKQTSQMRKAILGDKRNGQMLLNWAQQLHCDELAPPEIQRRSLGRERAVQRSFYCCCLSYCQCR